MGQPTIDDVAAAAGVSAATVSRALRGLDKVHPDTRARVRQAAKDLDYIASPTASGLASGRTRLIGVITPFMGRWFFTNVISAIDKTMRDHNHHLLLMDLEEKSPDERLSLTQSMMFKRVDGLIVINIELNAQEADLVSRLNLPVVTVGSRYADAPWVGIDDVTCGRLAAEHLIGLGHSRIAYLGVARPRSAHRKTPSDRLAGFRRAMHDHEVPMREEWVLPADWSPGDAYTSALALLSVPDRPTAVLAASDEMAVGVLGAALELGIRVPEQLSVVGIDDHDVAGPLGLTTVRQGIAAEGAAAARALLGLLGILSRAEATDHELPVELVVRRSTAPPPA
ncbi:MAG: LacI family DNA-binding transcriptional regulator [Dermatophilaceae bacterium]